MRQLFGRLQSKQEVCFDLKINRCSCESRWNCCHARLTEAASHRIADWGLQTVFSSNNNNNNNCSNKKTLVDLILLLIGFSVRTEIEENLSHFRPFQNFKVFPRNKKISLFWLKYVGTLRLGPIKVNGTFFSRPVIPRVMLHGSFNAELLLGSSSVSSPLLHLNCSIVGWRIISLRNNARKQFFVGCSLFFILNFVAIRKNFN